MRTSPEPWELKPDRLEALLRGTVVMGTGGGGSADFGRAIMANDFAQGRTYHVANLADVPDDALVVSGGIMGSVKVLDRFSPQQIVEQWERQFEPMVALRAMEEHLGRKVDFLVPFELGGLNTPVILSLAARAGIPVIDGDGVGRSAPETQMTSFIGRGASLVPMPLADWRGNVIVVKKASTLFFPDEVGRFVVTEAGGLGANTHYPMDGKTARNAILPDTISFALDLGEALLGKTSQEECSQVIADRVLGKVAFKGTVRSLREEDARGFLVQTAEIEGLGEHSGSLMEIVIKNEFMMASLDGQIGCVFPDLILLVNEHGQGVMSSELKEGDRVQTIIAPCHPRLREAAETPIGAEALGAARYGRPGISYEPVEELSTAWGMTWPKA